MRSVDVIVAAVEGITDLMTDSEWMTTAPSQSFINCDFHTTVALEKCFVIFAIVVCGPFPTGTQLVLRDNAVVKLNF